MKNLLCLKNKGLWVLLVFVLFSVGHLLADVGVGVTGGMNISKVNGQKFTSIQGWKPASEKGWNTGLKMRLVGPISGIGADLAAIYSYEALSLSEDLSDVARSIIVPVHLRWERGIPFVKAYVPFIFAGPQVTWLIKDLNFDLDESVNQNIDKIKAEQKNLGLKFDIGAGVLLFEHTELFYTYTIPTSSTFYIDGREVTREDAVETAQDIRKNYKVGVHRIGLTIYF